MRFMSDSKNGFVARTVFVCLAMPTSSKFTNAAEFKANAKSAMRYSVNETLGASRNA